MAHTTGKLKVEAAKAPGNKICYYNVVKYNKDSGNQSLASFHGNNYLGITLEDAKDNAKLFAAAPVILEALINITKRTSILNGLQKEHSEALAAIKQATE